MRMLCLLGLKKNYRLARGEIFYNHFRLKNVGWILGEKKVLILQNGQLKKFSDKPNRPQQNFSSLKKDLFQFTKNARVAPIG